MIKTLPCVFVLATASSLFAQAVTVNALVAPPGGGAPAAVPIGSIQVNPGANGAITADFTFAGPNPAAGFPGGFGFLDNWYDFRWINIVVGYTNAAGVQITNAGGQPIAPGLGVLPAMDPQPAGAPGGDDNLPYYYNAAEWGLGFFGATPINPASGAANAPVSRFADQRINHPVGTTITFECYLVVRSITDVAIAANELVVLEGFRWTHSAGTGVGGANVAAFGAALAANPGRVTASLAAAGGGGFPAVAGVGAWTALPSGAPPGGRILRGCLPEPAWWQSFGHGCDPANPLTLVCIAPPQLGMMTQLVTMNQTPNPSVGATWLSPNVIVPGIDLAPLGAPGCMAYIDLNNAIAFTLFGSSLNVPLMIPNSPTLNGLTIYGQSAWFDPFANPLGFRTSNGVSLTIGF